MRKRMEAYVVTYIYTVEMLKLLSTYVIIIGFDNHKIINDPLYKL